MATREYGNIYFRKYYVRQEVHKYFCTVLLLILIVDSRDTLFLVCFTYKNVRTDHQWLLPNNVNRQKISPPILKPVKKKKFFINGIRGDLFGYQRPT